MTLGTDRSFVSTIVRFVAAGLLGGVLGLLPLTAQGQASPAITGTVVEAGTQNPLLGAEVSVRGIDSPDIFARTETGVGGTFQLPDLRRGTYVLRVQLLGYEVHQRTMTLEFGETRDISVALTLDEASFDSIVLSPSRHTEQALDAPSSVSVLTPEAIRREGASSSVEALRPVVGVNVAQTGVDRRMLSLRGFGSPFSDTPHVRVDGRTAEMPLLGANVFGPTAIMPSDLSRIEVVRGPVPSLYGPEASGGLVHFFSRSPFQEPGTSLSLAGGSKSFVDAQFRQAGNIGGTVGYKFTGQFSRANEWTLDPNDAADADELDRYYEYEPGESLPSDRPLEDRQLRRDDLYRTFNTNGQLSYRFSNTTRLSLRGGYASLTSPLQTGIGTVQADELSYGYGHLHLDAGRFSASVGLNRNLDIGEAYRLETGETILNESTKWTGQAQYGLELPTLNTRLLFGGDFDLTTPGAATPTLAEGLGDERIGRYGGYLQSTTELADPLRLTLSGRVDYNDVVEETSFAPIADVILDLADGHTLRASYTRSASFPGTDPLFAAGRFEVDPDVRTTSQTVEVGYKASILDRVRMHVDGYYETKADVLTPVLDDDGLAYRAAERIEYGGVDASVNLQLAERTSLFANASVVTDDQFGGSTDTAPVALNAPSSSIKGGIDYGLPSGFSLGSTVQYVDGFPIRWGPYVGRVDAYTRLDVRAHYRVPTVPGLQFDVTVKNVLGDDNREFVGAPELGRMIIGRLTYELP